MTSPALDLLTTARDLGVLVQRNGPKLRVVAPPFLPDHDWQGIVAGLAEYKPDVLALLDAEAAPADNPTIFRYPRGEQVSPPWTPRPTPWRAEVGTWSLPSRERWGRRSEELELAGVAWPESERRAFEEIRTTPVP